MLAEEFKSKRPLSMISLDMNTTSRSTANRWSLRPRIITPSTKAAAGAFLISSLMPQAWRTMRRSKSRYFSNIRRASSISLPELSTASAHLRNKGYRPPCPESSSFAISSCDRCSRLPLGATRASTMSDDRIVVSTRHLLRIDIDGNVVLGAHPHFDHVGIGQGDASVGPVIRLVIRRRMLRRIGEAMDHDRAPGRPSILVRAHFVLLVGIGHLNGEEVVAAGIAPGQKVVALRGPKVVFAFLLPRRTQAQLDFVLSQEPAAVVQVQLVFRLMHDHQGRGRDFLGRGGPHGRRQATGQRQRQPQKIP